MYFMINTSDEFCFIFGKRGVNSFCSSKCKRLLIVKRDDVRRRSRNEGSGMSFMDKLANVLGNVATRINNLRYIMVIKRICCIDSGNYYGCFWHIVSAMVFDSENGLAQISYLRFRRIKAYRICHQLCHTKFLDHLCCFSDRDRISQAE